MEREARCLCGKLSIKTSGDPKISIACNCTNCQHRTGSPFGAGLYFADEQLIEQKGEYKTFGFQSDSGNPMTTHFCPECGSSVYWKVGKMKGLTGVAAGCFTDTDVPEPTMAVWARSKHQWVEFPEHWHVMEKQGG